MLTNLVKLAAEKARDAAEEYLKLQNVDMAIKHLKAAKDFNGDLPNLDDYFTAYRVHQLAEMKSTWYEILAITDPEVDISTIKKQYKRLALMLHPDKNPSIAADGAFKIVQTASDVLTNPEKREAYDRRIFCSKKSKAGSSSSWSQPRADGDSSFSRAPKPSPFGFQKTDPVPNTSSHSENTDPLKTSYYSYSQCSARVEIGRRDGRRRIIISANGRDENFLDFGGNDSSVFRFCCSFFFGNCPPSVIIGS